MGLSQALRLRLVLRDSLAGCTNRDMPHPTTTHAHNPSTQHNFNKGLGLDAAQVPHICVVSIILVIVVEVLRIL